MKHDTLRRAGPAPAQASPAAEPRSTPAAPRSPGSLLEEEAQEAYDGRMRKVLAERATQPPQAREAFELGYGSIVQAKLKIGKPGNSCEEEAERMAEQVSGPRVQTRKTVGERNEVPGVSPAFESRLLAMEGRGQSLPKETRKVMESKFGYESRPWAM